MPAGLNPPSFHFCARLSCSLAFFYVPLHLNVSRSFLSLHKISHPSFSFSVCSLFPLCLVFFFFISPPDNLSPPLFKNINYLLFVNRSFTCVLLWLAPFFMTCKTENHSSFSFCGAMSILVCHVFLFSHYHEKLVSFISGALWHRQCFQVLNPSQKKNVINNFIASRI